MTTTARTPEQIRDDRNARRRAKSLADMRSRMARHAAFVIVSSEWDGTNTVPAQRVISKTSAMYGNCRQMSEPLTPEEAQAALDDVLSR